MVKYIIMDKLISLLLLLCAASGRSIWDSYELWLFLVGFLALANDYYCGMIIYYTPMYVVHSFVGIVSILSFMTFFLDIKHTEWGAVTTHRLVTR